jgi:chemotaxis protein MotB
MGRPLIQHAEGSLVTMTLQVPAELKNKLQANAIASNRSLSQETQRRLERSFSASALQEDAVALAAAEIFAQYHARLEEKIEQQRRALKAAEEAAVDQHRAREAELAERMRIERAAAEEAMQQLRDQQARRLRQIEKLVEKSKTK